MNKRYVPAYYETEGYVYIYLPKLERVANEVSYEIGQRQKDRYVNNTGTYNVYQVTNHDDTFSFELIMYGTQMVRVVTSQPRAVTSNNDFLKILSQGYDESEGVLQLEIQGRNIQGERGIITLTY